MKKIGVIGLGNMGCGMVFFLQCGGYEVIGYDVFVVICMELVQWGLYCVDMIVVLVVVVELVVLLLLILDIVEQVVLGEGGLLYSGKVGLVIVDIIIVDFNSMCCLVVELQVVGMELVDVLVSGGFKGVVMVIMGMVIGGSVEIVVCIELVLVVMSVKCVYVGLVGVGYVVKLFNNLVIGIYLFIVGEVVCIVVVVGLDVCQIFQGLVVGLVNSKVIEYFYLIWIFNEVFDFGFIMKFMCKDLCLVMNLIEQIGSVMLLVQEVGWLWVGSVECLVDVEDFNCIVIYIEFF